MKIINHILEQLQWFLFSPNNQETQYNIKITIERIIEELKQIGHYPPFNMDYEIVDNENNIEILCNNLETYNYFNNQIN